MIDIFPLDSSHISENEDGTWRLGDVIPTAIRMIIADAENLGIKCTVAQKEFIAPEGYPTNKQFDVVFQSHDDMNYYKLTGGVHQGLVQIFSDSGLVMHIKVEFVIYSEHYTEFYG